MELCLSFDDGRSDSYTNAFEILLKSNLCATFHVATGFVDGTYISDDFGLNRTPLTIEEISKMDSKNMEICSHGDKHLMESEDFRTSINKFKTWGIIKEKYGFSVPNSRYESKELNSFIAENKTILSYIRVGRNPECYKLRGKINYVLYKLFRIRSSFIRFNKYNLIDCVDCYSIYSLVIKKHTRVSDLICFIEKYKNSDYKLVLMLHSIVEKPNDDWEWSKDNFEELCLYLSNNKSLINVLTLEELVANENSK